MVTENEIKQALGKITHPESGKDIVSAGIVDNVTVAGNKISVELAFRKKRDPFAKSIKRQAEEAVREAAPGASTEIIVREQESAQQSAQPEPAVASTTGEIGKVVAVASGKGGVGKSTVTANLAATLRDMGYKVGILDADIYGPSMPKMFGVEEYVPQAMASDDNQQTYILPAEADGIKICSIGFFISPDDALLWRGPMATSALKQLIHQTVWDKLDFLLIDMPPGTGDVHLSIVSELRIDGAVVVSTPQQIAIADARRGVKMFRTQGIDIPILGIVENMAWFSPAELPNNKYYLFGRDGAATLARAEGIDMLGQVPIILGVMQGAEDGRPAVETNPEVKKHYVDIASKIVNKLRTV